VTNTRAFSVGALTISPALCANAPQVKTKSEASKSIAKNTFLFIVHSSRDRDLTARANSTTALQQGLGKEQIQAGPEVCL